jgi:Zn finger protein HypA/HybF involved in hydrogenase expression
MPDRFSLSIGVAAIALVVSGTAGMTQGPTTRPGVHVETPPPPFSEGIFPCSNCHAPMTPNRTRRVLADMHTEIELRHDEQHRWCLDCHDAENRDFLHLANGDRVPFSESYQVCGQCHGEKYRDWQAGVHGRRVGEWNGRKSYLLCPHCHNPHQPRFKALAPKPAPKPPTRPGAR